MKEFFRKLFGLGPKSNIEQVDSPTDSQAAPENTAESLFRSDVIFGPRTNKQVRWDGSTGALKDYGRQWRLFSRSMRANPSARTTGPNLDKLRNAGLPVFASEHALASWLDLSESQLWFFANHRLDDRVEHYVRFAIPKRTGGERIITAPKKRLKAIQRKIHHELTQKLRVHEASHGFCRGKSIATHAANHVGSAVVVRIDLEDFFGCVTFGRVRGKLIAAGYDFVVATALALLCTEAERQPVELPDGSIRYVPVGHRYCVQGAPTSPTLSNAIAYNLDCRLAGYAQKQGWTYSRYADDLTFSGNDISKISALLGTVGAIVEDEGFRVNRKKTQVMRQSGSQRVTGIVVNDQLSVPRKERRRIRAMIHQARQSGDTSNDKTIEGFLAFLGMVNDDQRRALERIWRSE